MAVSTPHAGRDRDGRYADDAAVPGRQGGVSRCAAAVSHGRFLRDVLRRRQDGGPRAGPGADQPRQGRKRRPHGRLSPPSARKLPGQADRRRPARRHLRSGRRRQAGQGPGPPRSDAHRHARHRDRRRAARPAREQLSGGRRARRRWSALAWVDLSTGRFHAAPVSPGAAGRRTGPHRAGRMPAGRGRRAARRRSMGEVDASRAGPAGPFRYDAAREALPSTSAPPALEGFGFDDGDAPADSRGRRDAGLPGRDAKDLAGHIDRLVPYRPGSTLEIDAATRRSLEITRTLREGRREGSLLGRASIARSRRWARGCWPIGWPTR